MMKILKALTGAVKSHWRRGLLGMVVLACSTAAWASSCSGRASTITLTPPAAIAIPRDAVVGTLLTSWIASTADSNWYQCTGTSGSDMAGVAFEPLLQTPSGLTISSGGVRYTVFNTSVAGVGIAVGVSGISACSTSAFRDLGTPNSGITLVPAPWVFTNGCTVGSGPANVGGQAQIAFVKTGPITPGTASGGVLFEAAAVVGPFSTGATLVSGMRKSFKVDSISFTVGSCTIPDMPVSMGSYKASTFTGPNSSSNPIDFSVAVNSCPAGLNGIQYSFDAPSGVINATAGVIALSSNSTATGIGLQLKDNSGNALKYNTNYTLSSYNKSTGGSYTIPLKASYYQTGKAVTAGSANGTLTITMTYQ
ncbi:fimbrial protein [Paraburkholderia phytofirmans]|nr:fimbrial protein [Paraburkholderia phytofirmans]